MNCKPGDIAVFVGTENAGKMVRVLAASPIEGLCQEVTNLHGRWWDCEALTSVKLFPGGDTSRARSAQPGTIFQAPDHFLRPLRDPGDDAADEMLRPLPIERPVETA